MNLPLNSFYEKYHASYGEGVRISNFHRNLTIAEGMREMVKDGQNYANVICEWPISSSQSSQAMPRTVDY